MELRRRKFSYHNINYLVNGIDRVIDAVRVAW